MLESFLSDFSQNEENLSEILHLQDELSQSRAELIALQTRFIHK
jgi:hypothetical protein